jgi:fucose permease
MILFISRINLTVQIAATIGLGLFMSGIYSTILANAGPNFSEYRLAFGYFFMLAGLGPVILPTVIGVISERYGIQIGIRTLGFAAAALLVISFINTRLEKK